MSFPELIDLHIRLRGVAANHATETNRLTERAVRAALLRRPSCNLTSIAPLVVHPVEFTAAPDMPGAFMLEPPAYRLHRWTPSDGFVTHTVLGETFSGLFPFLTEPADPGQPDPILTT